MNEFFERCLEIRQTTVRACIMGSITPSSHGYRGTAQGTLSGAYVELRWEKQTNTFAVYAPSPLGMCRSGLSNL